MPQQILPPEHTSPVPDDDTKLGIPDHTGPGKAGGRVLRLNLGIVKFGTDNTTQAIALLLSVLVLALIMIIVFWGPGTPQSNDLLSALKNILLITIGVAVGNGIQAKNG
ncbi:hypothetical protein [Sphingomonas sp. Root710]|uniref:hypothetical protein n=1 Tax=Sphingomonas sp. Root710 TaxID=1736594 RepID=UPI0012E39591|nr:hypothetical protein [Sphingomonas sp. Root710]